LTIGIESGMTKKVAHKGFRYSERKGVMRKAKINVW
jgi:hypothetical protein